MIGCQKASLWSAAAGRRFGPFLPAWPLKDGGSGRGLADSRGSEQAIQIPRVREEPSSQNRHNRGAGDSVHAKLSPLPGLEGARLHIQEVLQDLPPLGMLFIEELGVELHTEQREVGVFHRLDGAGRV